MKFLLQLVLTAALSAILQTFLPFWVIAPAAFGVSMIFACSGFVSFINGFLSIALLWGIMAYTIDAQTSSILTSKIAAVFSLSSGLLVLVVAIIGGLLGGFSALTGCLFGSLFRRERQAKLY